jgi:phosphoribosylanthranilate isomerase
LHGNATPELCSELAQEFRVIRALSTNPQFEPEHTAASPDCDVLIDAHHPELRGGTGQTCDWSAARAAMRHTRFLILSGGLNPHNVERAIAAVMPHAVDVCTGIESSPGVKDHRALEQFISAVRLANSRTRDMTLISQPLDNVILSEAKDLGSISNKDS